MTASTTGPSSQSVSVEPHSEPEHHPSAHPEPHAEFQHPEPHGEFNSPDWQTQAEPTTEEVKVHYEFIAFYILIVIGILFFSGTILISILKSRKMRTQPGNMLVISVLTSSLMIGTLVIPAHIINLFDAQLMPDWFCKTCEYFAHTAVAGNVLSVVCGSILRLRSYVIQPHPITTRYTGNLIICIWIISALYGIRAPFIYGMVTVNGRRMCGIYPGSSTYNTFRAFVIVDILLLYFCPAVIIGLTNALTVEDLIIKQKNEAKTIGGSVNESQENKGQPGTSRSEIMSQVWLFIILWFLFTMCGLPMRINIILAHFFKKFSSVVLFHTLTILSLLCGLLNPLAVLTFNKVVRRHWINFMRHCKNC